MKIEQFLVKSNLCSQMNESRIDNTVYLSCVASWCQNLNALLINTKQKKTGKK